MEKIIHNQAQLCLDDNNILYKYQSGFRKYYSTDTCLSYLNNKVQIGFEQSLVTGMILIDLQKVFDAIDHDILSEKNALLGFLRTNNTLVLNHMLQTGCSRSM